MKSGSILAGTERSVTSQAHPHFASRTLKVYRVFCVASGLTTGKQAAIGQKRKLTSDRLLSLIRPLYYETCRWGNSHNSANPDIQLSAVIRQQSVE